MGKTSACEYAAKNELDAAFVRIGDFLSASNLNHLNGKVLYLDGLDEHRSRADGIDVVDAIIARLKALSCPKFRISCRTAEWHGGKDLSLLSSVSKGTSVVQLDLQPLTPEGVLALIPGKEDFIEGAKKHGLNEFLRNPQDALLLYSFYCERNRWPSNRSDLMEGACRALLKECNVAHSEAIDDWITDQELERASNYLASILLMSNVLGISSTRLSSDKNFPCIQEFGGDLFAMKAATRRNVFKSAESNRIEPKHRKIAEYMAARYLASCVRKGLPISRIMALITGFDGGTAPDLRGVYAWLVTLMSGMADLILIHDPYGAIIYGDAHSWTPNTKKRALLALEILAKKDPWFRGSDWSGEALGGLSDPTLIKEFARIIAEDECKSHLVSSILDAIACGPKLIGIGETLLAFIRNPAKPDHLKRAAIGAVYNACPDKKADLVNLLNDVNEDRIEDKEQYLRGELLVNLYLDVIPPREVIRYFAKPSGRIIGSYHMFLHYGIFDRTDTEGLRELAHSLIHVNHNVRLDDEYEDKRFFGTLICQLIDRTQGDTSTEELCSWLSMGLGEHKTSCIGRDEAKSIREFLEANDQIYFNVFWQFFQDNWTADTPYHQIWWRFRELTVHTSPPQYLPELITKCDGSRRGCLQETDVI